jgi:hypothetical protein
MPFIIKLMVRIVLSYQLLMIVGAGLFAGYPALLFEINFH